MTDDNIFESIRAGADGYMLKEERASKIQLCIEETMEGGCRHVAGNRCQGIKNNAAGRVL
ncbi:MAG: hypothetical protein WDN75_18735 [Bacteroidota bacterium]